MSTTRTVRRAGMVVLVATALVGCSGVSGFSMSLEWLIQVNTRNGSLVRAYGGEGDDQFVAILQPTGQSSDNFDGYLAIGHSDSWTWESSLWILPIDPVGIPQSSLLFEGEGFEAVAAERGYVGSDGDWELVVVGNATDAEGGIIIVQIDFDTLVVTGSEPVATAVVHRIASPSELAARGVFVLDTNPTTIVGSHDNHPMIMSLDLSQDPPAISWQVEMIDVYGEFTSVARTSSFPVYMACGTVTNGPVTSAVVSGISSDGTFEWTRLIGDTSSSMRAGAMTWMGSISDQNYALVGTSDDNRSLGWIFHAVEEGGEHRESSYLNLGDGDYSASPPGMVRYDPSSGGDGAMLFAGHDATAAGVASTLNCFNIVRRFSEDYASEYGQDRFPSVTITGFEYGGSFPILCGSMESQYHHTSPSNADGVLLWPVDGGHSYPANLQADAFMDPVNVPSSETTATTASLSCTVTRITDWILRTDHWPDLLEY